MIFQLNEQGRHRRIECTSANTPSGNEMAGVSVTARAPCMVARYIHAYMRASHQDPCTKSLISQKAQGRNLWNKMHRWSLNLAEGVI
jgi:hypothetical protein